MKQIVIISGKGGTGKTVVTGSFASFVENKIMVDCDVDASNLHLLLHPKIIEKNEFRSGHKAIMDKKRCTQCGKCISLCRFNAISNDFNIDPFSCEGCDLCSRICPQNAISMEENISGDWFVSETKYGTFVHAKLGIAEENSGKLVAKIRQVAKELAQKQKIDYVIIDGPPGIGCPVIASLSGVDCALIVTEPTLSGLHDALRVIEVTKHFKIPVKLVINKFDLNIKMSEKIENFCSQSSVPLAGKIPFDKKIVESMVQGKTIFEHSNNAIKEELVKIWNAIKGK